MPYIIYQIDMLPGLSTIEVEPILHRLALKPTQKQPKRYFSKRLIVNQFRNSVSFSLYKFYRVKIIL